MLRISHEKVKDKIRKGEIMGFKLGGQGGSWRVPCWALSEFQTKSIDLPRFSRIKREAPEVLKARIDRARNNFFEARAARKLARVTDVMKIEKMRMEDAITSAREINPEEKSISPTEKII